MNSMALVSIICMSANAFDMSDNHTIAAGNPFADTDVHASHYAALPAAMGYALEAFARTYPDIDRNLAYRFLELAVVVGAEVPWMVYSHEAGHFRVADRYGWDPEIEMTGWASGLTRYRFPAGASATSAQYAEAAVAGVNQETLNNIYMFRNWALNGGTRYTEALGYLLAQTNLALYAANSFRKGDSVSEWDDIAIYVDHSGTDVGAAEIMAMAIAADLLSASFWTALIGSVKFLATGERRIEIPAIRIGSTKITYPNFHLLLDTGKPILGGTIFIKPDDGPHLELRSDVRSDGTSAAMGARLHGIAITDWLRLSPHVAGSYDADRGLGYAAGADLNIDFDRSIGVRLGATYGHNFMLNEVQGHDDGVTIRGGLTLRF